MSKLGDYVTWTKPGTAERHHDPMRLWDLYESFAQSNRKRNEKIEKILVKEKEVAFFLGKYSMHE